MQNDLPAKREQDKINELLQDVSFAKTIAARQQAAYANAGGNSQRIATPDSLIEKKVMEEKTAVLLTNIYAVECAAGAISKASGKTPAEALMQMANRSLDEQDILLLTCFADATYIAGLPFTGLAQIRQHRFDVTASLPETGMGKDLRQVMAAAKWWIIKLGNDAQGLSAEKQYREIETILQDKALAAEAASYLEAAFDKVPPGLPQQEESTVYRSLREETIAINLAGFYALAGGLFYLSTINNCLPSQILKDIQAVHLPEPDKALFERLANATWKAGQPFRGLDRITRSVFRPFGLLPPEEVEKDWHQIEAAAGLLAEEFVKAGLM